VPGRSHPHADRAMQRYVRASDFAAAATWSVVVDRPSDRRTAPSAVAVSSPVAVSTPDAISLPS